MLAISLSVVVTYVLLGSLLLWFVIGSRGRWYLKLLMILLTLGFSTLVWRGLGTFDGWPANTALPQRAFFVSGEVIEPDPSIHEPGRIYIWLIPPTQHAGLFGYSSKGGEPRAYSVPYTRNLHKAVQDALEAQKGGKRVEIRRQQSAPGQRRNGKNGKVRSSSVDIKGGKYKAYILPPTVPSKD